MSSGEDFRSLPQGNRRKIQLIPNEAKNISEIAFSEFHNTAISALCQGGMSLRVKVEINGDHAFDKRPVYRIFIDLQYITAGRGLQDFGPGKCRRDKSKNFKKPIDLAEELRYSKDVSTLSCRVLREAARPFATDSATGAKRTRAGPAPGGAQSQQYRLQRPRAANGGQVWQKNNSRPNPNACWTL
jgi:hypothetical protein